MSRGRSGHGTGSAHRRVLIPVLLILAAVLITNLNCLTAEFVWDDGILITGNPLITHGKAVSDFFTKSFLTRYYRPVVMLSFAAEYAFWGPNPFGFHLTNLLLHAANSLLVFLFLRRILGNTQGAFLAALLFALHPVHKGVAYISDRTGMLAAFFFLGSLVLYLSHRTREGRAGDLPRLAASLCLCALAVFSKEEALMLPVIVILLDLSFFPERIKDGWRLSAVTYIAFFATALIYVVARFSILGGGDGMLSAFAIEPVRRFLTIPRVILDYILLLIFPVNLDLYSRTPLATSALEFPTLVAILAMLVFAGMLPWLFKRHRRTAFGALWFLIVLLPMSNIIPIFPEEADTNLFTPIHFLYLPSVGFFLCAGIAIQWLQEGMATRPHGHLLKKASFFVAISVVLFFATLSIRRNALYRNGITLFEYVVEMHPNDLSFNYNLGNAYMAAGRTDEAIGAYQASVRCDPRNPAASDPWNNMGVAYAQKKMLREAISAGQAAAALNPSSSVVKKNLGNSYMLAGDLAGAERQFLSALQLNSSDAEAHNFLGMLYLRKRDYDKARWHLEQAVRIRPDMRSAVELLRPLNLRGMR